MTLSAMHIHMNLEVVNKCCPVSAYSRLFKQTKQTNLVVYDLQDHFSKKIGWTTRPTVLLVTVGLESAWQFIFNLSE